MPLKTIAFVGDIHCGSYTGLWPVHELPDDKSRFIGIRYLMDCWQHLIKSWPDLDLLCLMGDLIDGKQKKSESTGVFTTDLSEQAEAAVEILRPLVRKSKKTIRVWGTPYHEGYDSSLKLLDKELDVSKVAQVIDLKLPTGILNLAHHPSGGGSFYQGTQVSRESVWSMVAAYRKQIPDARWIVRGHRHDYLLQETKEQTVILNGCWQLASPYAIKQNYFRFQPSIGATLMIEDENHPGGYRFRPTLYDCPMPKVVNGEEL